MGERCKYGGRVTPAERRAQLWTIGGSTPPPPSNPCGKPCTEDKDCNGNGGFFGNTCLVGGTRCAGHCAKRD